jgi:lipoic acid synthetase
MARMEGLMRRAHLHTICENAVCPNIGRCFERSTATFLILGDVCSRRCTFCAVGKGSPAPVDEGEPEHIWEAVRQLQLRYVVVTSVTRDDLKDGGASHFARVIRVLAARDPGLLVEVLIPDFMGSRRALDTVTDALPQVINHNIETVPRLYPHVRPGADYRRSLGLLRSVKSSDQRIITKSGLMLGLGEREEEVIEVMADLRKENCDVLTIGQYLSPSVWHHPVADFVPPEKFVEYQGIALDMGFTAVASGPIVRSSYRAAELYAQAAKASRLRGAGADSRDASIRRQI